MGLGMADTCLHSVPNCKVRYISVLRGSCFCHVEEIIDFAWTVSYGLVWAYTLLIDSAR